MRIGNRTVVIFATAAIAASAAAGTVSPLALGAAGQTSEQPAAFASWTRTDLPDPTPHEYGGTNPRAVVAFHDGYVAAGFVNGGCCDGGVPADQWGVLWTSGDGRHWKLHDHIAPFAASILTNLVTDGTTLVAVGLTAADNPSEPGAREHAAWASTDGVTWKRATGDVPTVVAAGPHGFIGAADTEMDAFHFVSSVDGHAWDSASGPIDASLSCMAVAADGSAMALGRMGIRGADGSRAATAVMWHSPDMMSWSDTAPIGSLSYPQLIAANGGGYTVIATRQGTRSDEEAAEVWQLGDGGTTERGQFTLGIGLLHAMLVSGNLLVVTGDVSVGDKPGDAVLWISTDRGATFGEVADEQAFQGVNNEIRGLVEIPNGIVGVGSYWEADTMHPPPAMWFSPRPVTRLVFPGAARARVE